VIEREREGSQKIIHINTVQMTEPPISLGRPREVRVAAGGEARLLKLFSVGTLLGVLAMHIMVHIYRILN